MDRRPSPTEDLIEELKDPEFKKEYGAEQARMEFAIALHSARTRARLTQRQLAGLLERSQPYIARLEGGDANPTLAAIGRMLAALDCRIVIQTAPLAPPLLTVSATAQVQTGPSGSGVMSIDASSHAPWDLYQWSERQGTAPEFTIVPARPAYAPPEPLVPVAV